jgi:hypothetical protein
MLKYGEKPKSRNAKQWFHFNSVSCLQHKHNMILTLQPSRKDPAFLASLKSSFSNISEYLDAPETN